MDSINAFNVIDGNQYQVNSASTVQQTGTDFDQVFNTQAEDSLDAIFERVAKQEGVDVNLLKAVAQAESGFDAGAVSYCGAQGMMQLMPSTSESLGIEDPFDAEQSITGGAKVLGYLLADYNGNVSLALAAYNAGSGNVAKYGGVPPFDETVNYINKINGFLDGALDNDSRTIEGATATNLSGVSGQQAPDASLHGAKSISQGTDEYDLTQNNAVDSDSNDSKLLSFKEYMYFVETYEQIMDELFDSVNQETAMTQNATDSGDSLLQGTDDTGVLGINVNQMNNSMLTGNTMERLLKSDAQSIYQAQASMVSPLVERLLNK